MNESDTHEHLGDLLARVSADGLAPKNLRGALGALVDEVLRLRARDELLSRLATTMREALR